MNVGKLRKKWECLLLLWLGHHYLLMSNNINTPTAVAIPLPGSIPTEITLPTVTATSCHEIYSIQGSPTTDATVYYRKCTEDSSSHYCFKTFIKCSPEPEVYSASNRQSEPQRSCFNIESHSQSQPQYFKNDTIFKNRGQVCGDLQSNHICGNNSCSLCLNLRATSVQEIKKDVMEDTIIKTSRLEKESEEYNVCVCEMGFKGATCSQLAPEHFNIENTDSSWAEIERMNENKGKNSWMVGIALVIFISITFLGVIGVIACCIYLFIKNAMIAHLQSIIDSRRQSAMFSADFLQEDIQPSCKFSDFKLCCGRVETDFYGIDIELDDIEVD